MSFIATLLARWIGEKWAGIVAEALPFIAVAALVWWVQGMRSTIEEQRDQIAAVSRDLATEQQARQRDIAGLTTLSKGLTAAAADSKKDQAAIVETINAEAPAPASPGLAAFLDKLRANDGAVGPPAAGAGR